MKMKNLVKGLVLIAILGLGVMLGANLNKKESEKVHITRVEIESQEDVYLEKGEKYIELSDGSYYIYGNGTYVFQPVDLGDWDYEVETYEQLMNLVNTYLSMKNTGTF